MLSFNEAPLQLISVTFSFMTPWNYTTYFDFLNHEETLDVQTIVLVLIFTRTLVCVFAVVSDLFFSMILIYAKTSFY